MATDSAKVTRKVREVLIEEGQHVEAGQVLATLDPIDANAQRDLANAQLGAARSQTGGVQAQLREAEANATRLGSLARQQLVSKAQYDQAVAQRDSLRAQLLTTQRNAQVAGDQLRIAGNGVDNTVVRAPFAGVVVAKAAQPGEIVSPLSASGGFTRTGIGTIVDMDALEVEVDVNEAYIGRVQRKMPLGGGPPAPPTRMPGGRLREGVRWPGGGYARGPDAWRALSSGCDTSTRSVRCVSSTGQVTVRPAQQAIATSPAARPLPPAPA